MVSAAAVLLSGALQAGVLPSGYIELESIRSTGTQYIDTEYVHRANTKIVCEAEVASEQPGTWAAVFGARKDSYQSNAFCCFAKCDNDESKACYNRSGDEKRSSAAFPRGVKTTLTCEGSSAAWTTEGGTSGSIVTTGTCDGGVNALFVFNLNTAGADGKRPDASPCNMSLYSFRIYEGEALKREFVPCLRDGDFKIGLYETQEGQFHANQGTGEFVPPPNVLATINVPAHISGVWTSGDGSRTNAIAGGSFRVLRGTENVTVILTAKPPYHFSDLSESKTIVLGEVSDDVASDDTRYAGCGLEIGSVGYLDADGVEQSCDNYELVTAETSVLTGGWYYVEGTVSRAGIDVAAGKEVHLILADDAWLTVQGEGETAGIGVGADETLNIYGQCGGTGRLSATGGEVSAGIGGSDTIPCGTVVINGGSVTAHGGAKSWAAGIGGGRWGHGGTVVINGGTVDAQGIVNGAGIGAGGLCLGSGRGTLVISGGAVKATSERAGAFSCHSISIAGGIFSMPIENAWCAAGYGAFENLDAQTKGSYPYEVVRKSTVTIDSVPVGVRAFWTSEDGSRTNAVDCVSFYVRQGTENVKVIFVVDPAYERVSGDMICDLQTVSEERFVTCSVKVVHRTTEYVDENGMICTTDAFAVVTADTSVLTGGWYLAEGEVSRGGIDVAEGQEVNLILADGASLTVQGGSFDAGIDVGRGRTLRIYGQQQGAGALTAHGGLCASGIGGGYNAACGTVAINGGTVTVTGGMKAAGIGGGGSDAGVGGAGAGGVVMIRRGKVAVTAGSGASVIGHGFENDDDGTVSIAGGVFAMTVESSWLAAKHVVESNADPQTKSAYPYAVLPKICTVTVPAVANATPAAMTNGSPVADFAGGLSARVGTTVSVTFAPDRKYRVIANGEKTWVLDDDVVFGTTPDFPLPVVEGIPGTDANPWQVGDAVFAVTNEEGVLTITGTGAASNFTNAAEVPWIPEAVTEVVVADGVTALGKYSLSGMDEAVEVNGTRISFYDMMSSARGYETIPGDMVLVSKTELEAAGAEVIAISNGKAYLGVGVTTNADLTATGSWGKVEVRPSDVSVENGSVVIAVPVNAEKGFMVLESKGTAK